MDELLAPGFAEAEWTEARLALESEIYLAFGDSVRTDISWSESIVIHDEGLDAEKDSARRRDADVSWQMLLNDPRWDPEPGVGGFGFLSAESFRYYLPAALIRLLRTGNAGALVLDRICTARDPSSSFFDLWEALNERQRDCVDRVVAYRVAAYESYRNDNPWQNDIAAWFSNRGE